MSVALSKQPSSVSVQVRSVTGQGVSPGPPTISVQSLYSLSVQTITCPTLTHSRGSLRLRLRLSVLLFIIVYISTIFYSTIKQSGDLLESRPGFTPREKELKPFTFGRSLHPEWNCKKTFEVEYYFSKSPHKEKENYFINID